MKNAANSVVVLVLSLMATFSSVRGATTQPATMPTIEREVAAEGSAEQLWVADMVRAADGAGSVAERTRVYTRAVLGDGWQRPMMIGAGVRDLSHRGSQLVALLKTGEWMFVWPDGRSIGPELPGDGEMLCVGSDGTTIWAVGRVAGGMASLTTRPAATSQPTNATEPASQPAEQLEAAPAEAATTEPVAAGPARLVLFRLDRSTWVPDGELPEAIPTGTARMSMTLVRGRVFVAAVVDGEVLVFERTDSGWAEAGRLRGGAVEITRAKLLDGGDRLLVWAAGETGAGVLFVDKGTSTRQWGKPVELRVQADLSLVSPRDVTVVAQRLKLVFAKGEKLSMQSFDWRTGELVGKVEAIAAGGANTQDTKFGFWMNAGVMAALLLVMIGAMRKRGEIEETVKHLERIPLAPLGLRLAAGLVDMWPQWMAVAYLMSRTDAPMDFEASLSDPMIVQVNTIAMLVYIVHTMVLEMLFSASIGKLIFGLKVTQLNGERAGYGAIFVRNLMRAVDLGLMFVGAVMIVLSPLRQRIGDLAAGTIVVTRTPQGEEAKEEETAEVGGK